MKQAADKVDTGIVGGHDDIPMLLQHVEGPEDKLFLSWNLSGSGQEVQHGPIQALVQYRDCGFPLRLPSLQRLPETSDFMTHCSRQHCKNQ